MNEARYREAERRLWESIGLVPSERELHLDRLDSSVRVQEVGDGPSVVFVHGGSASGANWAPLAALLPGFRCILLDRPGCGLSPALDADLSDVRQLARLADALVPDVLDALGTGSAPIVATSLGGFHALRAAAAHPERIDRIVEFGFVPGGPIEHVPISMRAATWPGSRRLMTAIPPTRFAVRAILRQLGLRDALRDGRISAEFSDWFVSLLRDTPTLRNETRYPRQLLSPGEAHSELLPPVLLAAVRCPVRFVWGDADPLGGAAAARRFVSGIPGAELELWAGVGHAPFVDDPERSAARIADFLAV